MNSLLTFTSEEPSVPKAASDLPVAKPTAPPVPSKMNSYAVNKDNIQKYGDVISEMKMKANKRLPSQKVEMRQPSNTWFKIEPQAKNTPQIPKQPEAQKPPTGNVMIADSLYNQATPTVGDINNAATNKVENNNNIATVNDGSINNPATINANNVVGNGEKIDVPATSNVENIQDPIRINSENINRPTETNALSIQEKQDVPLNNPNTVPEQNYSTLVISSSEPQCQNTETSIVQKTETKLEQEIKMDSSLEIQKVEEIANSQLKQLESEITSQEYLSRSLESSQFEASQSAFVETKQVASNQELGFVQEKTLNVQESQNREFEQISKTQTQTLSEIQKMEEHFEKIIESNNVQSQNSISEKEGVITDQNLNSTLSKEFERLTSDLKPHEYQNTVYQPPIMTTTNYNPSGHGFNTQVNNQITAANENIIEKSYLEQNTLTQSSQVQYEQIASNVSQIGTYQSQEQFSQNIESQSNSYEKRRDSNVNVQNNNNTNVNYLQGKYLFDEPQKTAEFRDNTYNSTVNYSTTRFESSTPTYFPAPFPTASSPVDFVDLPVNIGFPTASSPIETSEVFDFPTYSSFNKFEPSSFQSYSNSNQREVTMKQSASYKEEYKTNNLNMFNSQTTQSYVPKNELFDYNQTKTTQPFENQFSNGNYGYTSTNNQETLKSSTGLKSADLLLSSSFKDVSSNSQPSTKVEKVIKLDASEDSPKYSDIAKNINIDFKPVERAHVKEVGHEYLNTPRPQSIALDEEVRGLCEKSYVSAYEYQLYEEDKCSSVASLTESSKYGSFKTNGNGEQSYSSNSTSNGGSQVNYSTSKKPPSLVPGAVPIFGGAILGFKPNESPKIQRKVVNNAEVTKRPFYEINDGSTFPPQSAVQISTIAEEPDYTRKPVETKPPQPHVMPHKQVIKIRQEEIELPKKQTDTHDSERSLASKFLNLTDDPNETIPVKSLIDCFEQTTRPVMKFKHVQEQLPKKHGGQMNGISEGGFQPYAKSEKSDTVFVCNTTTQQKYFNQNASYQEPTGYTIEPTYTPVHKIAEPYRDAKSTVGAFVSQQFGYQSERLQNSQETEVVQQTEEERRHIHEENKKIVHEIEENKPLLTTNANAFYTRIGDESGKMLLRNEFKPNVNRLYPYQTRILIPPFLNVIENSTLFFSCKQTFFLNQIFLNLKHVLMPLNEIFM